MSAPQTCMAVVQRRQYNAGLLVWKERTRRQMGLPPVLWLRSQNAGVPRRERHCSIYLLSAVAEECSPQMQRPQCASMEARMMAREIYKNVWQDHRQDILEEYQQEQENRAANSEKVEEALSWQESFPNDEISREFLDRFVPRIFSIDGQKFIWELNLFQESCTVQCNVRGTYNYHSISAEKIMPGKTKAKKGDGAVNRILEDSNSTRFWVHTYDDDPISRQPSSRLAADLPASITIKLNYEQARAYRNSRGYVLWPGNWKDLTVKVLL